MKPTTASLQEILDLHGLWLIGDPEGRKADLKGASLQKLHLPGVSLAQADLKGANFHESILSEANFAKADLRRARFIRANLKWADLEEANLEEADLREANLEGASLRFAILKKAQLAMANLEGADLIGAILENANLREASLYVAKLTDANLEKAYLGGADLKKAYLYQTNLAGANLRAARLVEAFLYLANLAGADLEEANLIRGKLIGANLQGANLIHAKLKGANLEGANLKAANLEGADLEGALLTHANLEGANLDGANLAGADLTGSTMDVVERPTPIAYGHKRKGVKALAKVTQPMKVAAFKQAFPEGFEAVKHDIGGGTLHPEAARKLIDSYGLMWTVSTGTYRSVVQRLSPKPNEVLQLNIRLELVTDEPGILATIEKIRQVSYRSGHPVLRFGPFTVGWIRFSQFPDLGVLLIEEVQSDLPIVRKGISDEQFQQQLVEKGLTNESIALALDVLEPFTERFYADALSLVFDIAEQAGLAVEMLSYAQKAEFRSPRSVYEQLPKSMGMRKVKQATSPVFGEVWTLVPNGTRRNPTRRGIDLPNAFEWRQQ
jgi:uncharacterized protein YjbI with pentapeptide repeats